MSTLSPAARSGHAEAMRQESVVHRVHPRLRPFVAAAVGYRHEGLPPGQHLGLPSPFLTVIVALDEPLEMAAHPDPAQSPGRYDGLVGGLHTRPARIAHPGRQSGIQLSLTPAGARALLGCPAAALASLDAPLDDVLGPVGAEVIERVRSAEGWAARFAVLEAALLRRVGYGEVRTEVAEAWRLTTASAGRLPVAEVAARVGWSVRHLEQRFRAETGLGPKEAARVARFDRARRALAERAAAGRGLDLAGLAGATGFADQAHLTREWRAFSGLPPTRWLAREFGFVQDTRALSAALSTA
ncbi:AraC family transcriptional regulator [Blastococcus goldschmidtiae]|uniref:Helix-turn-helix domain-containing protein n=1 Tax=Blastococcus goldschmidtiae TaxID=3075546 RepID=A0ABU2K2L6_9ACTN|nr:helix-turn-helix domain-containing protein [Blastococcus sp. DSM 46792]MDT0274451.1 helix-turn-helix domain-containing protein [Blastococcus sp. DSM 46792]